jgi:hypothetical protein
MKNEHIVQFLQAFPFNPSCNQLLEKLDEYCQVKTTYVEQNPNLDNDISSFSNQESVVVEKSNQHIHDLKDNPSSKQNHLSKLFKLLDLRQYFNNKANSVQNDDNIAVTTHSVNANQNVYKVEMHVYDLLFLVQKIKLGLETSEDVYKIMTDEKSKTQIFVPLYFEIVTNNDETYLELIQDEQYPSFVELYVKNNPNGLELKEFLNLNIYFSHFISFLVSWLCKQDVLEEKGKPNFIKYFQFFLNTQNKITDFIENLG